jgi:hypothetical protein
VTQASDPNGCQVALLAAQASDPRRVLSASPSSLLLPTVQVEAEPSTASIQRAVEMLLGRPPVLLRANGICWHENWDTSAMFVEIEPVDGAPPEGLRWAQIGDADDAVVEPAWARASVAGWLRERAGGWSLRRPQWSRPGWFTKAGAWMRDEMRRAGLADPAAPQIHYLWGIHAVLVADSPDGRAYLKASGDRFRHEGAVTQALAARNPGQLPDVIAVEADRGWMLMRDFEADDLGEQPPRAWHQGLDALADLQLAWLGDGTELLALGAEDRSLPALTSWVAATGEDDVLMGGLADGPRQEWLATIEHYVDACHRLDALGMPHTLVHGDFHPWNVAVAHGHALIFDWTDASLAHPFVDLATYVMRTSEVDHRVDMAGRYLERWRPVTGQRDDVIGLALVVGALHQAQTYTQLIPTVMPEDLSNLRGGDAEWLVRAMRFRRDGLAARY